MKKNLISMLLITATAISLAACGGSKAPASAAVSYTHLCNQYTYDCVAGVHVRDFNAVYLRRNHEEYGTSYSENVFLHVNSHGIRALHL